MLEMVANWPQSYIEAWKMCITLQKNFHVPHNTDLYCKKKKNITDSKTECS